MLVELKSETSSTGPSWETKHPTKPVLSAGATMLPDLSVTFERSYVLIMAEAPHFSVELPGQAMLHDADVVKVCGRLLPH